MGDPLTPSAGSIPPPPPPPPPVTLVQASSSRKKHKPKVIRAVRNAFRSLPIITPVVKIPGGGKSGGGARVTGTLFGCRKGHVSLAVQANPKTVPMLVVELGMQTQALQKELSQGMLRIALECEKRDKEKKTNLLHEPRWTMYANGINNGYGLRREATEEDLYVMELLKGMSMGAGVLPPRTEAEGDGEMSFMRWQFDRVVGSKDSETLYMLSPEGVGNNEPDLSIFFIRS
ncbi:protein MIZU-KUSSEI 1-like [Salvia miltiorrhiza]|uniref:protein MIZU-KUSSEI 1-like n=1 Tax=Salvia miltiorrhiza TaxID=226208 RepID=UPI0025ACC569|nr:protein MIZU-KUSSEI 1-like [Salvia miltiorrhiza]